MSRPVFPPRLAISWILDFDGTITQRDTLDALVHISASADPERPIHKVWQQVTQAYLSDYSSTLKTLAPGGKFPTSVIAERGLLKHLEIVERASLDRVSASDIFTGITAAQLQAGAAKALSSGSIQLRPGVHDFLHHIQARYEVQEFDLDEVGVLSVNWSQTFVCACLEAARSGFNKPLPRLGLTVDLDTTHKYGLTRIKNFHLATDIEGPPNLFIYANELEGLGSGGPSTGRICVEGGRKIISSNDKLNFLQMVRKVSPYTMKPIPVVYVGDSWTDFECLLAAELGICIRDDPVTSPQRALEDSFKRLGIHCPHISEWQRVDEWGVVWARDFVEILQWTKQSELPTSIYPSS